MRRTNVKKVVDRLVIKDIDVITEELGNNVVSFLKKHQGNPKLDIWKSEKDDGIVFQVTELVVESDEDYRERLEDDIKFFTDKISQYQDDVLEIQEVINNLVKK